MFQRHMTCMTMLVLSLILCCRTLNANSESELRVGISPFKPFVILDGEKPIGVSIDAWRILAREMGISYDFIECKGVADKLQRLKDGGIDIAIGGITITEAREEFFDFTHPVYHTGLDILIPKSGRPTLIALISSLFKGPKTIFFVGLLVLIVIAGHIIWLVERSSKKRATSFHRKYFPGVFEGMYWALITASTIGYGDKVPKRWIGRILTAIIIIIFLPLFGYFIAQLSSDLTMQNLKVNINGPQDLRGRTVGVVKGTTSQEYMEKEPAYIDAFDRVEDAIEALLKGSVDAVVYDAPNLLHYANGKGKGRVSVVGKLFEPQDYGMALPAGSPMRERINRALLGSIESDELENIQKKWFGDESSNYTTLQGGSMIQRIIILIGAFMIVSACASTQKPKIQFPTDTRIGIINHLEHYVTHQNFSSLRFGSFSRNVNVNWNMPAYIDAQLIQVLQKDPRYTVVPVKPSEYKNHGTHIIDQISMSVEIKPDVAGFLKSIADKHDTDVIIVIKSFQGPGPFKIADAPVVLKGYGLLTRKFIFSKKAYAYANFAVIAFKTTPLTYLGSGKPKVKKRPLENLNLADDLKILPPSEIDKIQPTIEKYAKQAVVNALNAANLVTAK